MAGIFKIKYNPFNNALVDSYVFYNPELGSDSNNGTRLSPYGENIVNNGNKVLRGIFTKDALLINYNIADTFAYLNCAVYQQYNSFFYGLNIKKVQSNGNGCGVFEKCNIYELTNNSIYSISWMTNNVRYNFIENYSMNFLGSTKNCSNNTILNFFNYIVQNTAIYLYDSILVNNVDLYNYVSRANISYIPIFKYCIFLKKTQFKWNGSVIPVVYGNNPDNYLSDLLASLTTYANAMAIGADKTYLQAIIAGTFDNTCQIVDDSTQRIFNRYYNGIPIDFTLKTSNNPALTASSSGSYVGAYKGGVQLPPPEIKDINPATLAETANVPDFVVKKPNGAITATLGATQRLNAVKFTDVIVPAGTMLSGSVSDFKSGLGSSIMTVGIIQPLSINTLPQEGFAIIPKDAPGVVSQTLPKMTMKFNGETELFYKASTGLPLTFNDLAGLGVATDKNLALYGTWGVTTADYESYLLAGINTVVTKKIKIKYCDILIYIYNAAE